MKKNKKLLFMLLICMLFISNCNFISVEAASKPKLSQKSVNLFIIDDPVLIKITGCSFNAINKASVKSLNPSIASAKLKKYKRSIEITPNSIGNTTIICQINKTKLKCKVKVKQPKIICDQDLNSIKEHDQVDLYLGSKDFKKKKGWKSWKSSDENIAAVSYDGHLYAEKAGTVTIRVECKTLRSDKIISDSITITILPGPSFFMEYNDDNLNLVKQRLIEWEKEWPTNSLWGWNDYYTSNLKNIDSSILDHPYHPPYVPGLTSAACAGFANMTLEYLSDYKYFYKQFSGTKIINTLDGDMKCLEYDPIDKDWIDQNHKHHKIRIGDYLGIENGGADNETHAIIAIDISDDQKTVTCVDANHDGKYVKWGDKYDLTSNLTPLLGIKSFWNQEE